MGAYLIKRLLLIIPTLFGIMILNFAIIQIVPGGPVEQMIAQMTGIAVESTARFSGGGESETLEFNSDNSSSVNNSKYRGAQGLDPDIIKEIEELKNQLKGDMLTDMEIKDKIHNLEMKLNGTKPENTEIDCIGCGS